ncbi:MAG: undecaprenyl-diphosphate phosphatase [Candidatus Omnitrophica bacterium]|nr:undecaprenyl-diphosphate phosphatase [Candidatus Omnitrophota bacterium]
MKEPIIFGLVQGLTEFLPISSSGHLYFLERLFQKPDINKDLLPFFVLLHMATLLSIGVFFFKEIKLLFTKKLLLHIFIITAITGIFGIIIEFYLDNFFGNKYLLTVCFLINAAVLFNIKVNSGGRTWESMKLKDSFIIGILQGFSPFPGISRSGITIAGLLKKGFTKKDAFNLSFLMAIPVILGAVILKFREIAVNNLFTLNVLVGFVFAFVSGLLALKLLKKIIILEKMKFFAYYCLLISIGNLVI